MRPAKSRRGYLWDCKDRAFREERVMLLGGLKKSVDR
jgi:hypothetical protein